MNKYAAQSKQAQEQRSIKKMCHDKFAFYTEDAAKKLKSQRVYKCPHCGLWHRSGQLTQFIKSIVKRAKS